jgi:alpha-ribazole phosphatase
MELYLVRHTRPLGVEGLCYGRLEVEVDHAGTSTAAAILATQIPPVARLRSRVYCSPAMRCMSLARLLSSPHAPICCEDLLEMDFGAWEGVPWDRIPRVEIDAWAAEPWTYRPGNGESAQMIATRWRSWSQQVRRCGLPSAVVVTHAGVIRVALAQQTADPSADLARRIPFASVHRLEI